MIAVVLLTTSAAAGGLVSFGFQADGAAVNFDQPFSDIYGSGFGGGVHLDIDLPLILALRISGDYISFSPDVDKYKQLYASRNPGTLASEFSIDGGRIGFLSFAVNGKVSLPAPIISPYLTAGAGTTTLSVTDVSVKHPALVFSTPSAINSQTKFSANVGVGVDVSLIVVSVYLEAKYTWIFTEGATSTYVPVSLGITL